MKKLLALKDPVLASLLFAAACLPACKQDTGPADKRIKRMDTTLTAHLADSIGAIVKPELAYGLSLTLWGIDSQVISPNAIHIDDQDRVYYTTTDRQKHSEFDIRGHRDSEIPS